jgi:hypothetical protein
MKPLRMVMTKIPSDTTWHKKQEYMWFRGGDLNGFWDIWALPISKGRYQLVWPWPTYHKMPSDTRNKNIYGLEVGISMVYEIYGNHPIWSWLTNHQMLLDTRNKNTYGLGWGFNGFRDGLHFLYQGGQNHSVWSWPTYHQMRLDTRSNAIYGLGMGISMVFEILEHFLLKGHSHRFR